MASKHLNFRILRVSLFIFICAAIISARADAANWVDPTGCEPSACSLNVVDDNARFPSITSLDGVPYVSFSQDAGGNQDRWGSRRPIVVKKLAQDNWSVVRNNRQLNPVVRTNGGDLTTLSEHSKIANLNGHIRLVVSRRADDDVTTGQLEVYDMRGEIGRESWSRSYLRGFGAPINGRPNGPYSDPDIAEVGGTTVVAFTHGRLGRANLDFCRNNNCQLTWLGGGGELAHEQRAKQPVLALLNNELHSAVLGEDIYWRLWATTPGDDREMLNVDAHHDVRDPAMTKVGDTLYITWREHIDRDENGRGDDDIWRVYVSKLDGDSWERVIQPRTRFRGQRATVNSELDKNVWTTPDIADIGGVPYIAFSENHRLRVKRWDAGSESWIQVGSVLNVSSWGAYDPKITNVNGVPYVTWSERRSPDGKQQVYVKALDSDADGVVDGRDNCRDDRNADQNDFDNDGRGDACDSDDDGDGVRDRSDNCPWEANANQSDRDADDIGDACEGDRDSDGTPDADDSFPDDPYEQADWDEDSVGDNADNCPDLPNRDQRDADGNGTGDACQGAQGAMRRQMYREQRRATDRIRGINVGPIGANNIPDMDRSSSGAIDLPDRIREDSRLPECISCQDNSDGGREKRASTNSKHSDTKSSRFSFE